MENIRQAIERAKADESLASFMAVPKQTFQATQSVAREPLAKIQETPANSDRLQRLRIVAYDGSNQRSRPYDMLRTQVLQSMKLNDWKILGVTSPTPECGKTVLAINLAFSIARQPDQSVVLVDMDLQKPRIGSYFELSQTGGLLDLLKERVLLQDAIVPVRAESQHIAVLPTGSTRESSELMCAPTMRNLLHDLRANFRTIILDLPPMLSSDDVLAILPQIDCVLLVAAAGLSKVTQVAECLRHLQSSQLVRLVLNKTPESDSNYYY